MPCQSITYEFSIKTFSDMQDLKNFTSHESFAKKGTRGYMLHKIKGTKRGRYENYEAGEPTSKTKEIPRTKVKKVPRMRAVHWAQRADWIRSEGSKERLFRWMTGMQCLMHLNQLDIGEGLEIQLIRSV